jgi:hypothetical protein
MKRLILPMTIVLSLSAMAMSQTAPRADQRTFELRAIAPPSPALKYQLLFDDMTDRRPGNAALLYLDAVLLMGPDAKANAQKALAAFDAKDMKTFDSLADSLNQTNLFEELDQAARREECDWQAPFREMGIRTMLPHLEPLVHGIARLIKVRALRQLEQGKVDDALAALRLGYELSDGVGKEPILISGLVSLAITGSMNDALVQLMNRSDAPNLYWPLSELPARKEILRHAFDGERLASATSTLPNLARYKAGDELTAAQWRETLDYVAKLASMGEEGQRWNADPIKDAGPQVLVQARQYYSSTRHTTIEQTSQVDPAIVLGSFYLYRYEIASDEMFRLRGLPYPLALAKAKEFGARAQQLQKEQPANPFFQLLPTIERAIWSFARADRQLAALTTVEAIRSYAAANSGKLPQRLEDVKETPVPTNPASGKAFEYRVQGDSAVLSDLQSQEPLTYEIKIRK